MALQKRRDLASMPDGLMDTSVEVTKGMIVTRVFNADTGEFEIALPKTEDDVIYGFVTLRQDSTEKPSDEYDKIDAGIKAVVYTLVRDNEWATDQFTGALEIGDLAMIDVANPGKIKKCDEANKAKALFQVTEFIPAMQGYKYDMVTVKVLK